MLKKILNLAMSIFFIWVCVIYNFSYDSNKQMDKNCLISTFSSDKEFTSIWENKENLVCNIKVHEWSSTQFHQLTVTLQNEIYNLEQLKNNYLYNMYNGHISSRKENVKEDDFAYKNELKSMSKALSEIPTFKIQVDKYKPNIWITLAPCLAWFIISLGLFLDSLESRKTNSSYKKQIHNNDLSVNSKTNRGSSIKNITYSADRKLCATCVYWCGKREANSFGSKVIVELNYALCLVSKMTKDPLTNRSRGASAKKTPPDFGLHCKYHKSLFK